MIRRVAALLLVAGPLWLRAGVRINEVSFDEGVSSPDWVELFNPTTGTVSLDGWVIDDGDTGAGRQIVLPRDLRLPPGGFLTVFVDAAGPEAREESAGSWTVYSGTATTVNLAATEDQVALYWKTPLSSATLVDFVAWVTDGDYGGNNDRTHLAAAAAGLWPAEGAVELPRAMRGQSVGRRRNGASSGGFDDFQPFKRPTRGASNEPPPSPFPSALTVDPATRSFSPFDGDARFQTTRFYFNVPPSDVKSLAVHDVRGRRIVSLMENDRDLSGPNFTGLGTGGVVWDGRDQDGNVVPMGRYLALFESTDPSTGETRRARAHVAVGRPR